MDEATGIVHHEVVVSPLANWLGTVQLRHSSREADRLTLIADAPLDGRTIRSTFVWARAPERNL